MDDLNSLLDATTITGKHSTRRWLVVLTLEDSQSVHRDYNYGEEEIAEIVGECLQQERLPYGVRMDGLRLTDLGERHGTD